MKKYLILPLSILLMANVSFAKTLKILPQEGRLSDSVRASADSLDSEGVEEIQEEVNNKVERDSPTSVAEGLDSEAQGSFKSR